MIYFTSDTHFGHTNIIKYCDRPFSSVGEMDQVLIDNINAVVKESDVLWHLGDWAFRNHRKYRDRIVCRNIHLILGNHDRLNLDDHNGFASVQEFKELKFDGKHIVLCHYALRVWNKCHRGSWHLYGHSHSTLPDLGNKSFDCGVDCWDYKPLSIEQVEREMNKRVFEAVDHHE